LATEKSSFDINYANKESILFVLAVEKWTVNKWIIQFLRRKIGFSSYMLSTYVEIVDGQDRTKNFNHYNKVLQKFF